MPLLKKSRLSSGKEESDNASNKPGSAAAGTGNVTDESVSSVTRNGQGTNMGCRGDAVDHSSQRFPVDLALEHVLGKMPQKVIDFLICPILSYFHLVTEHSAVTDCGRGDAVITRVRNVMIVTFSHIDSHQKNWQQNAKHDHRFYDDFTATVHP